MRLTVRLARACLRIRATAARPSSWALASSLASVAPPASVHAPVSIPRPNHLAGIHPPRSFAIGEGLRLHAFPGSICNLYAVEYTASKRVLMLDGGCSSDVARVQAYLETVGLSSANVAMVVSSHAHPDHAGGAFKWKAMGVRVVAPRGINDWYSGPLGFMQWRIEQGLVRYLETLHLGPFVAAFPAIWNQYFPSKEVYFPRMLAWDREIPIPGPLASKEELDQPLVLDAAFEDWVAIPVPGHTDHMVALYHPASATLYAADALVNIRRSHGLQYSIQQDFLPLLVDSLLRLSRFPVRHLLMAHGGAFTVGEEWAPPSICLDVRGAPVPHLAIDFRATLERLARSLHGLRRAPSLSGWRGLAHEFVYLPLAIKNRHITRALKPRIAAEAAETARRASEL